ncbi:DUF4145 domain-containing protein [Rhodococcus sp. NPDC055112]
MAADVSAFCVRMVGMTADTINGAPDGQADDRNPDSLPTTTDPTGRCPRCNRVSSFTVENSQHLRGTLETVTPLRCQGCREATIVVEVFSGDAVNRWRGIHWWPKPGHLGDTTDVPTNLAEAFEEGARCVGVDAPNAAVAMFRNALAQIVQDKGSDEAKRKETLNKAIIQMVDDRTLYDGFKEWADHVRTVGNAGAHQESFESIPLEQAEELMELTKHLIDTLYVGPAKLRRAMPARKRPKP